MALPRVVCGPAKIDSESNWATHVQDDNYRVVDLDFIVPLDRPAKREESRKGGDEEITLHASIVYGKKAESTDAIVPQKASDVWNYYKKRSGNKRFLAYLCGGPGDENTYTKVPAINQFAIERGYQVLYLDYRGTGESTPFAGCEKATESKSIHEVFEYLTHFTQDEIAHDIEAVRQFLSQKLFGNLSELKLTLLAQSFGGWIALTYLSHYPTSLKEVLLTAAMPPFAKTPEEVYRQLYKRVINRNKLYYTLHPDDIKRVRNIVRRLYERQKQSGRSRLPNGDTRSLGYDTLLTVGRQFGTPGRGKFDKVHDFLVQLEKDLDKAGLHGDLSESTLKLFASKDLENFRLHHRPLYGLLHEAIYCKGPKCQSNWAARTVGRDLRSDPRNKNSPCPGSFAWLGEKFGSQDLEKIAQENTPIYFTGEMILPFMFEDKPSREVAQSLAQYTDWKSCYDPKGLDANPHNVPVKSVVYKGDMYVDWETSLEMGEKIGGPTKVWLVSPRGDVQLAVDSQKKLALSVDTDDEQMEGLWDWAHGSVKVEGKTEKVLKLLFEGVPW